MGRMKYRKLGHLNIDHEYFFNGYSRSVHISAYDLTILPLLSAEKLDALGIKCTSLRQNSITIYGEVEPSTIPGEEKNHLNKLRNNPSGVIYFALIPLNPQYALASDLPLDMAQDQCLFLSNRNIGNAKDTLSKGPHINWPADMLQVLTGEYRYVHPEKLRDDEAFFQERDTNYKVYPSKKIERLNASTELVFDQNQIKPGFYRLTIKNQPQPEQFLLGNWNRNSPLAIIELAWGPGLAPEARLWEADFSPKSIPPAFKAVFLARKARWKYTFGFSTLANPQGDEPPVISEMKLKMDDQDAFTSEPVADPAKEARFISNNELVLEEIPLHKLSLSYKLNGQSRPVKVIRFPSVESLSKTTDNQIQTHISITL